MAKKKAVPSANENGQAKSKIALGVELIEEWQAQGQDTRSSQGLLAELQSRYPQRDWKMTDVTNAKTKFGSKPSNGRKKRQAGKAPATTPTPSVSRVQQGGEVTASDLLTVKKLADQIGGLDKLQQAVEALTAIIGAK